MRQISLIVSYFSSGAAGIATKAGAWEEILAEQQGGEIISTSNIEEIKKMLMACIADGSDLDRLGKEGRSYVTQYYSIKQESEILIHYYLKVISS